jgi:hypothetical protein
MRQLLDLLVCFSLVAVLAVVVYLTPRVARYVSAENRPAKRTAPARGLAFHLPALLDESQ